MLTPQDLQSVAYWYRRISMSAPWCYFQCANCHVCILMLFRHEQTFLVSVFGKWGSTQGYFQWLTPGLILVEFCEIVLNCLFQCKMYPKVMSTSQSCLEAHAGFSRLSYEGEIQCLFTVTLWEKVDRHIINMH